MFDQIVYIHGYNGSVISPKVGALKQKWRDSNVVAPYFPDHDASGSHTYLSKFITSSLHKHPNMLLVGCSLGGFWATYLANEFKLPSLLLNPAAKPWETLMKYVGTDLTEREVHQFARYNNVFGNYKTVSEPRIILLEKGDDVIDPYKSRELYLNHGKVQLLPGGSHRFDNYVAMNHAVQELDLTVVQHPRDA